MASVSELMSHIKIAMKAKDKDRLKVLRSISAAIKQIEVDERVDVDDARFVTILTKMAKQRRESIEQFSKADRQDLIDIEEAELIIISEYLPQALTEQEISELIDQAMDATKAETMKDMGKVMGWLKPKTEGRADMGKLSGSIKAKLS